MLHLSVSSNRGASKGGAGVGAERVHGKKGFEISFFSMNKKKKKRREEKRFLEINSK